MKATNKFLGNHTHMRFGHNKTSLKFEAAILNQFQETIDLIKNEGEKVILSTDGKRLGDYQSSFRLCEKLELKLNRK